MPYNSNGIGWQKTDTSHDAAEDMRPTAGTLRALVLNSLKSSPYPMTTEQIALDLDQDYRSIQPRTSELREAGKIQDSGLRGQSSRGKSVIMWEITQ